MDGHEINGILLFVVASSVIHNVVVVCLVLAMSFANDKSGS